MSYEVKQICGYVIRIDTYPLSAPVGPIDVLNIRLNSMGSVKSLFVTGDFMLKSRIALPMSAMLIPST